MWALPYSNLKLNENSPWEVFGEDSEVHLLLDFCTTTAVTLS